ncbi:MAG: COX15/CtaA family protein, partial [Actinomycetota bacterium]|nr:COX15/CtaA family protein [Actinomycetota bacterium]
MATAPPAGFRRLALATVAATFALIVLGGIVRVSGSGLGCGPAGSGFHGWPLCRGDVIPGLDLNAVIEYAHRALASAVGLAMIALALYAWRRLHAHRSIVRAAAAAAALVVAQGLLGAATVEGNLSPALVAAHLLLGMLLLALVHYVWHASRPGVAGAEPPAPARRIRRVAYAAATAVLATIVAGGYMAGTERYGRTDYVAGGGAHHACGTDFPACNGGFLPFGQSRLADIHLTHRVFVYVAVVLVVWTAVMTLRRRPSRAAARLATAALALLAVQVLLGALNVWIAEQYEALILAHLAVGTLLWAATAGLCFHLAGVPAPTPAR